jgi:hypothetical protein
MPIAGAGQPFEAVYGPNDNGLVGTIAVAVENNDGAVVIGPTTADITEISVSGIPTGIYAWNAPAAPATLGQYTIIWSPDGTWSELTNSTPDELVVITAGATPPQPIPPPSEGGLTTGPCTAWATGDDVAACCSTESSSGAIFDDAADQASQLLFELSGRQFSGLCERTVRPACDQCYCGYQILSRGYVIGPWDYGYPLWNYCDQCLISCAPSRIKLAGYPVREITQVKIDGDVVDAADYNLWNYRYLTRLDNQRWPVAQDLTVADTEDDTFSVTYTYGASPPLMGVLAATELACNLYQLCAGQTCALPQGTTRITQQGVVIERLAFTSWAFRNREWRTGMPSVDAFLGAYNPNGIKRRPTFWAPGRRQYAQTWN